MFQYDDSHRYHLLLCPTGHRYVESDFQPLRSSPLDRVVVMKKSVISGGKMETKISSTNKTKKISKCTVECIQYSVINIFFIFF